ncbi:MAG: hypothetical protein FOGNACKC_01940 [Anaerolineae bacterium]|nr:hypothetical protein [Anaerolineae bacterium]
MTTLAHTTRIAVLVETDIPRVAELVNALAVLVGLLFALVTLLKPVILFVADFVTAADFTLTLFSIMVRSVAFGLGVRI